jgi:hypothetical protein
MPTLADIEHEVGTAGDSPWRQRLAVARGSLAIIRLTVQHGSLKEFAMKRVLTIVGLGAFGSLMFLLVDFMTNNGFAKLAPIGATLVLAPLVLRAWVPARTYRETFINCLLVTSIMVAVQVASARIGKNNASIPWYIWLRTGTAATTFAVIVSAVAAAVAWRPTSGTRRWYHERLVQALAGAGVFMVCWVATYAGGPRDTLTTVGVAFVLAAQFAALAVLVSLPLLALVRRHSSQVAARVTLPTLGAALFPLPLLLLPTLQGELGRSLSYLSAHPLEGLRIALPYIIGGGLLGWLVRSDAEPQPD